MGVGGGVAAGGGAGGVALGRIWARLPFEPECIFGDCHLFEAFSLLTTLRSKKCTYAMEWAFKIKRSRGLGPT